MGFPGRTRDRGLHRLGLALVLVGVLAPPTALAAEYTSGYGQMPPPPKTARPPTTPATSASPSKEEKASPERATPSKEAAPSKQAAPTSTGGTRAVHRAAGRPRARAATLHLDAVTSALAKALRDFGLIGAAGRGGLDSLAIAGPARTPATTHAERAGTRSSSSAKDPLGLNLPPEAGQAMMVALIVLAATLLLAVLFTDKFRGLLARFAQRPRG